jgi:CHAT domain-containing protein
MNTGLGLMELQKYAEAGPLLSRALAIQQHVLGQDHPDTAQTLTVIAALNEKSGPDLTGAYALNQQASAVVLGRARRESGRLDEVEGARNRAELVGSANILMRQAQLGWRLAGQVPERAAAILDEGFQMAQWAHQSAAAAALSQMTSRVAKDKGELPLLVRRRQDLVWRYRALDRQLIAASANPPEVRDAGIEAGVRKELAHLDESIRTLDLTLKTSFPGYAALANPEPLSVAEAQAQLRDGEVLYQISIGREKSVAWTITSGEARWQELPIGEEALKDHVEALRCGLDEDQWVTPTTAQRCKDLVGREPEQPSQPPFDLGRASKLYQTLLAPFEALIANRHLLFVPSGPLTTLPLHVLVTEAPSQDEALSEIERLARTSWLGKRQPITVLPSVASLKVARTDAKPSAATNPFISFANPLLSGANGRDRRAWRRQSCEPVALAPAAARAPSTLTAGAKVDLASLKAQDPLPETVDEACAVARSLGASDGDVYLGAKASEAVLKSLSLRGLLKTYRVVHFATHGLIAGQTDLFFKSKTEPSLLMTPPDFADEEDDGLLTASEIAELSLDADVVVLSACNTASTSGAPEAEALSGLARAFFYAGGRALLVTHWSVNSDAAVGLVTDTFSELKREPGLKLAEAMRRAMTRDIDAGGEPAHPAFWAPFVVVTAN